jgi:hypothetical protein
MTPLVTCNQLLASFTSSLENATPSQLAALSAALTAAGIGGGAPTGAAGGGLTGTYPDPGLSSEAVVAAVNSYNASNIGFAVRNSAFTMPSTATRTWATVPLDFNSINPSFGSWNAAKTEFTFSKAGAYMVNVTGPIGTFYSASVAGGQIATGAYLDIGTYKHWVGGSASVTSVGSGLVESAWCGASVPVNASVGMVIKLVMTTNSSGTATATAVFGLSDGVEGGGSAVSGMTITPM